MMSKSRKSLAPPNSIIFVADPTHQYDVSEDTGSSLVSSTSSCISVGTLAEMDGETTIELSTSALSPEGVLVFEGAVETPGLRLAVIDAELNIILEVPVIEPRSHVKIWANDLNEPDKIFVEGR